MAGRSTSEFKTLFVRNTRELDFAFLLRTPTQELIICQASVSVDQSADALRNRAYTELFEALETLQKLDEDEPMHIDVDTYRVASSVLSCLSYHDRYEVFVEQFIEDGEEAHCHIVMSEHADLSKELQPFKSDRRTQIIYGIWEKMAGPERHVCACDEEFADKIAEVSLPPAGTFPEESETADGTSSDD